MADVRAWVEEERGRARTGTDAGAGRHGRSVTVGASPWRSLASAELVANGALSLLNLCCYLLDRQLAAQASAFERDGGFTERLFRVRSEKRKCQGG